MDIAYVWRMILYYQTEETRVPKAKVYIQGSDFS